MVARKADRSPSRRWALLVAGVLFAGLAPVVAGAVGTGLSPILKAVGWREITFDGKKPNHFEPCVGDCVKVEVDNSVSMIAKPVMVDLGRTPRLSWEWMIDRPPPPGDLAEKGMDDRAVAVFVTFPYDPETASFSEKMLRPLVEMAEGADAPGRVISYVWGDGPPGQLIENPYYGTVNVMVVRRTRTDRPGVWLMEMADVVADHQRAFGYRPKSVAHVLISGDRDDSHTRGAAYVRNLMFSGT